LSPWPFLYSSYDNIGEEWNGWDIIGDIHGPLDDWKT
jgi:hypothetical protein